jgi:hypothetical protein
MKFYIPFFATVLVSIFILLTFGFLSLMIFANSLDSPDSGLQSSLLASGFFIVAAVPFIASMLLLRARRTGEPLGVIADYSAWVMILCAGAFGVFQIATDPGDAAWVGIPWLSFSVLFAASVRNLDADLS